MPNKLDLEVRLPRGIPRLLKWKNGEHQVHIARDLPDPRLVPGPNLRRDIINDLRVPPATPARPRLKCFREPKIEPGIIDQHHEIRFPLKCQFQKLVEKPF